MELAHATEGDRRAPLGVGVEAEVLGEALVREVGLDLVGDLAGEAPGDLDQRGQAALAGPVRPLVELLHRDDPARHPALHALPDRADLERQIRLPVEDANQVASVHVLVEPDLADGAGDDLLGRRGERSPRHALAEALGVEPDGDHALALEGDEHVLEELAIRPPGVAGAALFDLGADGAGQGIHGSAP